MATPLSSMSLCYAEAAIAKKDGDNNEEEYYHHLLNHFTGETVKEKGEHKHLTETHEHDIEYATKDEYRLHRWDPFGYSVHRGGFEYDDEFRKESYSVEDPETFAVLDESEFRKLHPRKQTPWVAFDVGGALPVDW
ncbi:hypothetical protein DL766_006745 [Monosporascus sp. MC13-8B]|uniref:Uncharacterized protein n=1 Tax=Monosporascus cannonballus TaxID=155416 RepID=A0ABY0H1D3_9PEZI|nr:hypothetical protein DL762_006979 [Monosporascus cannonballus]RYO84884.1 hypothetical protein DL763_007317 [Monosporascus cannonballus]RYP26360.1 hypothetical protein DL766_006745 [Monosporascus sp. MC13-8B]